LIYLKKPEIEICCALGFVFLKIVLLCTDDTVHIRPRWSVRPVQRIQYISDLGGVFGLWFGFALMTFVEICEFVTDLLLLVAYTGAVTAVQRKSSRKSQKTMSTDC